MADPYRWLKDTDSPRPGSLDPGPDGQTTEGAFLAAVPEREALRARLGQLWDYPRFKAPFRAGRAPVPAAELRAAGPGRPLRDELAEDEGRDLARPERAVARRYGRRDVGRVTEDGALLAYATSGAGSDWKTWHVREVAAGRDRADVVEWTRYARAAWLKDGSGFYYGAVDPPSPVPSTWKRRVPRRSASTGSGHRRAKTRSSSRLPRSPSGYRRRS